jgi:hypothetical protein
MRSVHEILELLGIVMQAIGAILVVLPILFSEFLRRFSAETLQEDARRWHWPLKIGAALILVGSVLVLIPALSKLF